MPDLDEIIAERTAAALTEMAAEHLQPLQERVTRLERALRDGIEHPPEEEGGGGGAGVAALREEFRAALEAARRLPPNYHPNDHTLQLEDEGTYVYTLGGNAFTLPAVFPDGATVVLFNIGENGAARLVPAAGVLVRGGTIIPPGKRCVLYKAPPSRAGSWWHVEGLA